VHHPLRALVFHAGCRRARGRPHVPVNIYSGLAIIRVPRCNRVWTALRSIVCSCLHARGIAAVSVMVFLSDADEAVDPEASSLILCMTPCRDVLWRRQRHCSYCKPEYASEYVP
jgi:hypothetical protein